VNKQQACQDESDVCSGQNLEVIGQQSVAFNVFILVVFKFSERTEPLYSDQVRRSGVPDGHHASADQTSS